MGRTIFQENSFKKGFKPMHNSRTLLLQLLLLTLAGCASVSMVSSSKAPAATTNYKSFLVVGISENRQMRQVFEEVMAVELRKKGLSATASYTITGVEEKLSRESIIKAVQATAVDAVITTRIADTKRATTKNVGYVMTDRTIDGYASLYGTGGTVSMATFDLKPVEITTATTTALESHLFDTSTQNLVWTGMTNAVDPQGIITASEKFAGVVITTLGKEGLIK